MQLYYLAAGTEKIVDKFGENTMQRFLEAGLPVALLGIVTVFAVLSIIWGCLEIFKYVFYTLPEMRKAEESAEDESASAPVPAPAPAPITAPVQSASNDEEVVAAIIAAITAMRSEEGISPSTAFRVVSFKKKK